MIPFQRGTARHAMASAMTPQDRQAGPWDLAAGQFPFDWLSPR